jgi:outer membrane protein TolC
MRWIAKVACLAGLAGALTGCSQQLFVTEADYKHYRDLMPDCLHSDPQAAYRDLGHSQSPVPVTISNPEKRQPWYLSLQEAIALAVENGTEGLAQVRAAGQIQDDLLPGNALQNIAFQTDSMRVHKLSPGIAEAQIDAALSRFDPSWVTFANWRYTDEQVVQGFGALSNGQNAHAESSLTKQLASGGLANVTFSTDYSNLSNPPTNIVSQNPAYTTRLNFNFEQPLLVGFGTDINELISRPLGASPGSSITGPAQSFLGARPSTINPPQGSTGFLFNQGIIITRIRFDQSRADFEVKVNYQLLNVETAYWNLYGAYVNMYATETGMRLAHRIWVRRASQAKVGGKALADAERAKGQFELFRGDRVAALNQVLESERILRRLLGLPVEDGKQLIPIDAPNLAPYHPDYHVAEQETLTLRPELIIAREELKVKQMDLRLQQHFLLPDLRLVSNYGVVGTGTRLDGNGALFDTTTGQFRSSNALRNLASTNFTDWNLGLVLNVPLGYRYEHSAVRVARLNLAQMWLGLKNEEEKAKSFLAKTYRDIDANYELIRIRQAQRVGFAETLRQFDVKIKAGADLDPEYESLLQSQRDWVNALQSEYQAVVGYNNAIASFQFAKGTIQQHDNVTIGEGPLPQCALGRASEHEHERSNALVLRERANPTRFACNGNCAALPQMSRIAAPSVVSLQEGASMDASLTDKTNPPEMQPRPSPYADLPATSAPPIGQEQMPAATSREPATWQPSTKVQPPAEQQTIVPGQLPFDQTPNRQPAGNAPTAPGLSVPNAKSVPAHPEHLPSETPVAPGEALPDLPTTVVPPGGNLPEAQLPHVPALPAGNAGVLPAPPGGNSSSGIGH